MVLTLLLYVGPILLLLHWFQKYHALSFVPGPFLAKLTDLYRLVSVYNRDAHDSQLALHRQYGDLVRLGPRCVTVSGPGYIQQIYAIDKKLPKSNFYAVFQNIVNGQRAASLVAMTNEAEHSRTKRQVAHAYSLSTLVEFEVLVDSTTRVLLETLAERFADPKSQNRKTCNLGQWLQFYAFDVIGELTFSKRLGFVETGEDVNDIIASIGRNFDYFSVLGQMPWLDDWMGKNPLYIKYLAKPVASPILKFAQRLLQERLRESEEGQKSVNGENLDQKVDSEDHAAEPTPHSKPDFLSRFLQVRAEALNANNADETISDRQLMSFLFANINAGSDTIASTLRAVFYHLLRTPESMDKLQNELRSAHAAGSVTLPCPTWQETQSDSLPYLRAIIKEALRLNPALSLSLERVVPAGGLTLQPPEPEPEPATAIATATAHRKSASHAGAVHLPAGTVVGINPYVLHREARIFDPNNISDPDRWDPDRWIEGAAASNTAQQIHTMTQSLLAFGAGKRSCLGKNIAMMELQKLVPALVMRFPNMRLVDSRRQWVVRNSWVLGQTGLEVDLE